MHLFEIDIMHNFIYTASYKTINMKQEFKEREPDMLNTDIKHWVKQNKKEIIADFANLIKIKSIAVQEQESLHPFGDGCAKALDYVLALSERFGLETKNLDYRCGYAQLSGTTDRIIGIFVHIDTSAVSDMWLNDPFELYKRGEYLIGCGAEDNKGAAISMIYLLRLLKESGQKLTHSIRLVFGCSKKLFMEDVEYYLEKEKAPDLSLVPDSFYPVCTSEKGSANFELTTSFKDDIILDLRAGQAANMVPDSAFAMLKHVSFSDVSEMFLELPGYSVIKAGLYVKVGLHSKGSHAAYPIPYGSPIYLLTSALLKNGLVKEERTVLESLAELYGPVYGEPYELDNCIDPSFRVTHICGVLGITSEHMMRQVINVRYPMEYTPEDVIKNVIEVSRKHGFDCRLLSNSPPSTIDPLPNSIAPLLTSIANRHLGTSLKPFTSGGVSYAHVIPNSIPFGINRFDVPLPPELGRGHTANEAIREQELTDAIEIYFDTITYIDAII